MATLKKNLPTSNSKDGSEGEMLVHHGWKYTLEKPLWNQHAGFTKKLKIEETYDPGMLYHSRI